MRAPLLLPLPLRLLLLAPARAQQIAQYTQYVFNQFSVNPAVAGSKDCLDVRLGFRQQWVGFPGAPVTAWASLHGATAQRQALPAEPPRGRGLHRERTRPARWATPNSYSPTPTTSRWRRTAT
ncbi:MAG: type IX secretion system membrane protein PorP/SprF [Flavobacteriales bacterium]|nr:type IX secretion system membrane protein PorP/SprF [Flavobacteriales bacterium]